MNVDMDNKNIDVIQAYSRAIIQAIIFQVLLGMLAGMNLDLGQTKYAYMYCSIPFWIGVAMIMLRRKNLPTKGDIRFIAYGLIPIMLGGIPLFLYVWERKGIL